MSGLHWSSLGPLKASAAKRAVVLPVVPSGVSMACYKRMDTVDLEEPIDLSTKSEKEAQVCNAGLHIPIQACLYCIQSFPVFMAILKLLRLSRLML